MSDTVHSGLLTVVDYAAIAILLGSMLLGMLRGLVRELFNLVGWVVAFFVARAFGPSVAHWLPADLPGGELTQGALGFLLVLIAVVFGAGIVSALVGRMTDLIGLRPADRGLGMLFGIVRGILLLMLLMVAAKLTALPQQPVWQQSVTRPWVEAGLERLMPYLPEAVQQYLRKPETAVPNVNPMGTMAPLPRLEPYSDPYRSAPESGGTHGQERGQSGATNDAVDRGVTGVAAEVTNKVTSEVTSEVRNTATKAMSTRLSNLMGGGALRDTNGTGLNAQAAGEGAGAPQQGWGMRSGGSSGSPTPSTGLHKVSE
ncbi:colicin v production transmembrane protein [Pandoraea captiosa]|uniref:Colicin v production transmembrane protein n=1 Tax=Pandoraea captiosa TaxID=2508302 RepID=A0A5E5A7L4_9BURK|nr:CvpA family protein [Pandoraea captiosa]VVE68463.1 colicin v production transmembrane protein [Pandoraea captiosa]